jgi:hypothetical protein
MCANYYIYNVFFNDRTSLIAHNCIIICRTSTIKVLLKNINFTSLVVVVDCIVVVVVEVDVIAKEVVGVDVDMGIAVVVDVVALAVSVDVAEVTIITVVVEEVVVSAEFVVSVDVVVVDCHCFSAVHVVIISVLVIPGEKFVPKIQNQMIQSKQSSSVLKLASFNIKIYPHYLVLNH